MGQGMSDALANDDRVHDDRLGRWCGWVLVGLAGLTPLLAWLSPISFAPVIGLAGLLCAPAFRIRPGDAPLAIVLLVGLAWAALSTLWSPHRPAPEDSVALKLFFQLPLYWSAWCGARRASPRIRGLALRVLAWGLAAYGVLLLVETVTGAGVYRALRDAIDDPIRPDLGRKNVAQGSFVLALLWPVAAVGAYRAGASRWLAVPMALGTALLANRFLSDAPVIAVGLALLIGALLWVWPRTAPRVMGLGAAGVVLIMPAIFLFMAGLGVKLSLPTSWAERMVYWMYATGRIGEHPWRGWGLDSSRAFSPHIQLHPHNGPLQLWLELGVIGAAVAALIWLFAFRRLARDERSLVAAATAGSAAVYFFFGAISFGVWQEWWLSLAAMVAIIAAMAADQEAGRRVGPSRQTGSI
jgi:O-antigen ligase